jgi:hypothetical protein
MRRVIPRALVGVGARISKAMALPSGGRGQSENVLKNKHKSASLRLNCYHVRLRPVCCVYVTRWRTLSARLRAKASELEQGRELTSE